MWRALPYESDARIMLGRRTFFVGPRWRANTLNDSRDDARAVEACYLRRPKSTRACEARLDFDLECLLQTSTSDWSCWARDKPNNRSSTVRPWHEPVNGSMHRPREGLSRRSRQPFRISHTSHHSPAGRSSGPLHPQPRRPDVATTVVLARPSRVLLQVTVGGTTHGDVGWSQGADSAAPGVSQAGATLPCDGTAGH